MTCASGSSVLTGTSVWKARHRRARSQRGVTLIELLVGIAVLAVMLAIGVPSFSALARQWRQDAAVDAFVGDLRLARSTAVRTSQPVTLCPSNTANTCGSGTNWAIGWLVFSDLNRNGQRDGGEPVIAQRSAQTGMASLTGPGTLSFRNNGTLSGFNNNTLALQPLGAAEPTLAIVINTMGRARVGPPGTPE